MSIYFATDWTAQCDAISRKTNQRCTHHCSSQIPNIIACHVVLDKDWFSVQGTPVRLCWTHARSWWIRSKRLLTVKLRDGGYLSAYNHYGYGSVVLNRERIDFDRGPFVVPKAWGPLKGEGNVPEKWRKLLTPKTTGHRP